MPLVQKWNWFCSVKGKNQERCSKTQIDIKNIWANRITEFLFPVIFLVTSGMHKAYFRSIFMKLPDCHITKPFFCNQNWWDCIFLGMKKLHFFSCTIFSCIYSLNNPFPGMDVPTAMMTNPIVKWLICKTSPIVSTHQIIPNEMATIHPMAIVKDSKYHLRVSSVSHGGIVRV